MLRIITVIVFSTCLSACASLFQTDIEKTHADNHVVAVDCKSAASAAANAPESVETATIAAHLLAANSGAFVNMSDLQRGIELIRNSVRKPGASLSETTRLSFQLQSELHMNLQQFSDQVGLLDEFGADAADHATNSTSATTLMSMRSGDAVALSRKDWNDFSDSLSRATASDGWTSSMATALGSVAKSYVISEQSRQARAQGVADLQKKYYLASYMRAYFRNGQIFELNFNDQDLKTQLINTLKKKITDPTLLKEASDEIDSATGTFKKALCKQDGGQTADCDILGVIGQETFVTRAGKSYGFPGITATLDPVGSKKVSTNKINWDNILEDLVRVFVEAEGDALAQVPGAANSTMCKEMGICQTTGDAKIEQVDNIGDETEAATSSVVSAVIRGGWLFSLNNEALADSITTAVSVTLRKVAEEATWKIENGQPCTGPAKKAGDNMHRNVAISVIP
jgi:hypothetical protein